MNHAESRSVPLALVSFVFAPLIPQQSPRSRPHQRRIRHLRRRRCTHRVFVFRRVSPGKRLTLGSDYPIEGHQYLPGLLRGREGTSPHVQAMVSPLPEFLRFTLCHRTGTSVQLRSQKSRAGLEHAVPFGAWKILSNHEPTMMVAASFCRRLILGLWRSFVIRSSVSVPTGVPRGSVDAHARFAWHDVREGTAFGGNTRGRLAPKFAADFVVLDRDITLEEILGTKVLAAVVDGHVAYESF